MRRAIPYLIVIAVVGGLILAAYITSGGTK